jgi:hypothetical protein
MLRKRGTRKLLYDLHQFHPPPQLSGCSIHLNKHLTRKQNAHFVCQSQGTLYNISSPKLGAYSEIIQNQIFRFSDINKVVV